MSIMPKLDEILRTTSGATSIWCTHRFNAIHHWPNAPDECGWLRYPHHHEFVVRLEVSVSHDDRDVEFILLAREVGDLVEDVLALESEPTSEDDLVFLRWSCEMWARYIAWAVKSKGYRVVSVQVSEEGVHGATFHPR